MQKSLEQLDGRRSALERDGHWWSKEIRLLVEAFVESQGGQIFTIGEIIETVDAELSKRACSDVLNDLEELGVVERTSKSKKGSRWRSKVVPLNRQLELGWLGVALVEEKISKDELGRQAREDFYQLVEERSRNARRRPVLKKF